MIEVVSSKKEIESFLKRDPFLHIYELGDLDDYFWPHTKYYALAQQGEIESLFMVYKDMDHSVLLALEENNKKTSEALIKHIQDELPANIYCHLTPGLEKIMKGSYEIEVRGEYQRMKLVNSDYEKFLGSDTRQLKMDDLDELLKFYKKSYPENWFNERPLKTGGYFGVYEKGALIAVAGVHVLSEEFGVAALGNIATDPEFRGRGYGSQVTSALLQFLQGRCDFIGLNVHVDNREAIRVYEKLGFEFHAPYVEVMASRPM